MAFKEYDRLSLSLNRYADDDLMKNGKYLKAFLSLLLPPEDLVHDFHFVISSVYVIFHLIFILPLHLVYGILLFHKVVILSENVILFDEILSFPELSSHFGVGLVLPFFVIGDHIFLVGAGASAGLLFAVDLWEVESELAHEFDFEDHDGGDLQRLDT